MSAFSFFLKDSIDYERTQQLILWKLLSFPEFVKIFTGIQCIKPKPLWESNRGLFDLGIEEDGKIITLIELKMWSGLSEEQLQRQSKFLKENNICGLHILLGTSGIEYFKNSTKDDIAILSKKSSKKIGYSELISSLNELLLFLNSNSDEYEFVFNYKEALVLQNDFLNNAKFNKNKVHPHHYCYSVYDEIRKHINEIETSIYSENSGGRADYIMNDRDSWYQIIFMGNKFELYQEFLNSSLAIRIKSDAPNNIKHQFKDNFINQFIKYDIAQLSWDYDSRASSWMRLALLKFDFNTQNDFLKAAEIFEKSHYILGKISNNF